MRNPIPPAAFQVVLVAVVLMWAGRPTEAVGSTSTLETTLTSTLSHVSMALSATSQFSMTIHKVNVDDFRLANAVTDCVDLLELSSLQLSSALSSVQTGKSKATKDLGSDLNTWLSAVITNLETCKEGLEGFTVDTSIADHVSQVSSLAWQALDMARVSPKGDKKETPTTTTTTRVSAEEAAAVPAPDPDVVVAQDGTGNFTRIMDAVEAAPDNSPTRFVIHVKKGVYRENVLIGMKKLNLFMYGDGIDVTVVTGDRSVSKGFRTFQTATFGVMGQGFVARDMTFENTAGPNGGQAVAFRSLSDLSALYRCAFRGFQDTLYAHSNRQFYRECVITGTVDFIFGNSTAVFQQCDIRARPGREEQTTLVVTAQGRNDSRIASGFTIQNCNITGDSVAAGSTFLGRPWKEFARTVVMESFLGPQVSKEGWLKWNGTQFLNTLYYAEYKNSGTSRAELGGRVKWPGYHLLTSSEEASQFTVSRFIQGDSWLPETGLPFVGGFVRPN